MTEPAITLQAYHVSSGDNRPVIRIVIHCTNPPAPKGVPVFPWAARAGTARGTANYFQQSGSGGSAQYVEGIDCEEHCVADKAIAWHAPPNPHSIGVEITGHVDFSRSQWLGDFMHPAMVRAAARTAELCARFKIPRQRLSVADVGAQRSGICGHVDVSQAFHQTDHTDPGPNFPWDVFMQLVINGSEDDVTDADKAEIVAKVVAAVVPVIEKKIDDVGLVVVQHFSRIPGYLPPGP